LYEVTHHQIGYGILSQPDLNGALFVKRKEKARDFTKKREWRADKLPIKMKSVSESLSG